MGCVMKRVILLFVKWPEPGRVKTRIAATVGAARAAEIYKALVAAVCARLPRAVPVIVWFDPAEKREEIRGWLGPMLPQAVEWLAQAPGDLGARLKRAFADAFAAGWERVAVVGSDCVDISGAIFDDAWSALESADVAAGPTRDGGYYLLALRTENAALFENIRWSTEHTLADTEGRAEAAGLRVRRLEMLDDVDTAEDWARVAPLPGKQ